MDTDDDQLANANMFGDDHKPTVGPLEAQARALLRVPALTDQRRDLMCGDRRLGLDACWHSCRGDRPPSTAQLLCGLIRSLGWDDDDLA